MPDDGSHVTETGRDMSRELTEFVWLIFSDETPEYDHLLLRVYGMISRGEQREVGSHVATFVTNAIAGSDRRQPSVPTNMRYHLTYRVDWDMIAKRMIEMAEDLDEVACAYVRTVARSHAIGEVRAYVDTYAALYGTDSLSELIRTMDKIEDPFDPKFPLPKPVREQADQVCAAAVRAFSPKNSDMGIFRFAYNSEFTSYGDRFARDYISELMNR